MIVVCDTRAINKDRLWVTSAPLGVHELNGQSLEIRHTNLGFYCSDLLVGRGIERGEPIFMVPSRLVDYFQDPGGAVALVSVNALGHVF